MSDNTFIETITGVIEEILGNMGIAASIEVEDSITKGLVFNVNTHDTYMLIGRQGAHLHALQTLVQAISAKRLRGMEYSPFMLDVDDYKRKREWFLKETAKQAVEKAKRIGKPVALEPMPNFERKIVHAYLQDHFPDVSSESTGIDPRRRVVVRVQR
jgi:spoIIIJ-associated protein